MNTNPISLPRQAAQMVKNSAAPAASKETKSGKNPIFEIYEDVFHQLPQDDNGPLDRNRDIGQVNYVARAPHGMADWDFEYTDNSVARSSSSSHTELIVGESQLELLSAQSSDGQTGTVSKTVYDIESQLSTEQSWIIQGGSAPTTLTLLAETQSPQLKWTGTTEEIAEQKRLVRDRFAALFEKRRS